LHVFCYKKNCNFFINNNMKRIFFIILIIITLQPITAQIKNPATQVQKSWFDKRNITFGGALGGYFGNNYSVVQVAPQIGYNFSKFFNAGFGLQYTYFGAKNNFSRNYVGMNVYGRVTIADYFVAMVQPEINRVWISDKIYNENYTELVPVILVGAGVRMGNVFMMLQYDIVQNGYSPYGQSIFYSVGVVF